MPKRSAAEGPAPAEVNPVDGRTAKGWVCVLRGGLRARCLSVEQVAVDLDRTLQREAVNESVGLDVNDLADFEIPVSTTIAATRSSTDRVDTPFT